MSELLFENKDISAEFLAACAGILGATDMLTDPRDCAAHADDQTPYKGAVPRAVLLPRDAQAVADIVALANRYGQKLVVQGGRTGLAGGARVQEGEVALSVSRLRAIGPVDLLRRRITVGAGAILADVEAAARSAGLSFPVDIGARGSATIGGLIATNAGGHRVLRYGMTKAQVAGLEAVMADGRQISTLHGLDKDNAGWDLGQLLIGSEGIFGILTAATLRLVPLHDEKVAALLACDDIHSAISAITALRSAMGDELHAAEVMFPAVYARACAFAGQRPPLALGAGCYVLVECESEVEGLQDRFVTALSDIPAVRDAALAENARAIAGLWTIREGCSGLVLAEPDMHGHDISLRPSDMADFLQSAVMQSADALIFGHLGDGNLHVIVQTNSPDTVTPAICAEVARLGGSIAAEHGIGADKRGAVHFSRDMAAQGLLSTLKSALDPNGILNADRVLPPSR